MCSVTTLKMYGILWNKAHSRHRKTIDLKKNRLRIHKSTLREMGSPEFVRLLFSPERGAIGVVTGSSEIPKAEEIRVIYSPPKIVGRIIVIPRAKIICIRQRKKP